MLVQPSLTEDWVVSAKVVTRAKADLATVQFAINLMNQDVPSSVINGTFSFDLLNWYLFSQKSPEISTADGKSFRDVFCFPLCAS